MAGLASYLRRLTIGRPSTIGARGIVIIYRVGEGTLKIIARTQGIGSKDGQAYQVFMRPGEKWFCAEEFAQVEVMQETGSASTANVELMIGYGDYVIPDTRINADRIVTQLFIPAAIPFTTAVAPANPLRWRVTIQNRLFNCTTGAALNPTAFSVTDNPDGDCDGILLGPGESVTIWAKGLVTAHAPAAIPAATTVPHIGVLEEVFNG